MKSLSKEQVEQLANLTAEVRMAEDDVTTVRDEINNLIMTKLNNKIDAYNEVVTKVAEFVDKITAEMENFAEDKGDVWSESDAGSNYQDWRAEWEGLDLGEIDRAEPVEAEADLADSLSELPTEPNR